MSLKLLALLLASHGALAGEKSTNQRSSCEEIKQNVSDLLGMKPVSASQTTQKNLSLLLNVAGVLEHCEDAEAQRFVGQKLLDKKFVGEDGIRCKRLESSIEGLLKDPRPTSSPRVNQFLSEATLQFKIYEHFCGKSDLALYNLSLCYSGGSCG